MTPAINLLKKHNIRHQIHQYHHDPACRAYGEEAAAALGVEAERLLKTLIVTLDHRELAMGLVPVAHQLDLKSLSAVFSSKRCAMAEPGDAQRATGYLTGGISPLGQKKRLRSAVARSALDHETVLVSAGRRGLQLELAPGDLVRLLSARVAEICRRDGS